MQKARQIKNWAMAICLKINIDTYIQGFLDLTLDLILDLSVRVLFVM